MPVAARGQITEVVLVAVGFLLESDMVVSRGPVMVLEPQHKPFDAIPDEKRQVEQFTLLRRMNQLMIQFHGVEVSKREDEAKQVNGQIVAAKRMAFDFDDVLHIVAC